MGCQGNELIVPSPSVDFTSNNQILKYQCPYYNNMWVYKNPTRGMISLSGPWTTWLIVLNVYKSLHLAAMLHVRVSVLQRATKEPYVTKKAKIVLHTKETIIKH